MNNKLTKQKNKDLKKITEAGFIPDDNAVCKPIFEIGEPFPSEIMALWWAYNGKTEKHKLLGFRTYGVEK